MDEYSFLKTSKPAIDMFNRMPIRTQAHILVNITSFMSKDWTDNFWKRFSTLSLTDEEMIKYRNVLVWKLVIQHTFPISLNLLPIKTRSISQYVSKIYRNLSTDLVKQKFCKNKNQHDKIEAVHIWYTSPHVRPILFQVYGNDLFDVRYYTSYAFYTFLDDIFPFLDKIKQHSTMPLPKIFNDEEELEYIKISKALGCSFSCCNKNCLHFPTPDNFTKACPVCTKIHSE